LKHRAVNQENYGGSLKKKRLKWKLVTVRDKFNCKQCGGQLTIPRLFFIATYVTCPYCQTQNTFTPSTGAQMVLQRARSLAEQRTAHLLKRYQESKPQNKTLYQV